MFLNTSVDKSGISGRNNWKFNSKTDYARLYIDRPIRIRFHLDADSSGDLKKLEVRADGILIETFTAGEGTVSTDGWNCDTGDFTGYGGTDNVEIEFQRRSPDAGDHYVDDIRIDCAP